MSWQYSQSTGVLIGPDDIKAGEGYSGHGEGFNNPTWQDVHNIGPIPRGEWQIGAFFDDPGGKGPFVAHLTRAANTETFGRSGFMIHGDNEAMNHTASDGCIILSRDLRVAILASGDRTLVVSA